MTSTVRRGPRVVMVAFTAQPNLGSEYEVGWQWPRLATGLIRPVVLTRQACWNAIPAPARLIAGVAFKAIDKVIYVAVDFPGAAGLLPGRRLMRSHYLIWQVLALAWIRARRRQFALAHHVTFVAAWFPPLAAFSGLPFAWGPIGNGPAIPKFYRSKLGLTGRLHAVLRDFVTRTMVVHNPLLKLVASRTRAGFAIASEVRDLLPRRLAERCSVHPAIGVDPTWLEQDRGPAGEDRGALLFVGRATEFKLPRLAACAGARAAMERPELVTEMVGEGLPDLLRAIPRSAAVRIVDHMAQHKLRTRYRNAALLLFPSVEASGFVTLEAMAFGLPVVGLRGTGVEVFTGSGNPFLVDPAPDFAATCERLAAMVLAALDAPQLRAEESLRLRDRIMRFEWSRYRPFLAEFYARALGEAVNLGSSVDAPGEASGILAF